MKKSKFKQAGFTLVEIMVVVAIIGLLATVVVVGVKNAQKESQITACHLTQKNINSAISRYQIKHRTIDPNELTMEQITPYFDDKEPTCPSGGEFTFEQFENSEGDIKVRVVCSVEGHNKESEEGEE